MPGDFGGLNNNEDIEMTCNQILHDDIVIGLSVIFSESTLFEELLGGDGI